MTDLHDAVKNGDLNKCRELIENGDDVNKKDVWGNTPLHWATFNGYEMCELLIKNGADINAKNYSGQKPLYLAVSHNYLEICECLIEHGADVNAKFSNGRTPLHYAAMKNYFEICECLFIKYQAVMNLESFSKYRRFKHKQSKLIPCFRYFGSKTDKELLKIIAQSDGTIR